jgi:hypothetical protein
MRAVLLCDFREGRTSFARSKQSSVSTGQQLLDELHKGTVPSLWVSLPSCDYRRPSI